LNSERQCCSRNWPYIVTILGTFLIVGVLVWVMVDFTKPAPLGEDRAGARRKNLADLRAANTEALDNPNYVWQDPAKGIVRMPIKDAMELSLKLSQDKVAARTNLMARVAKATAVPPKAPEKPVSLNKPPVF